MFVSLERRHVFLYLLSRPTCASANVLIIKTRSIYSSACRICLHNVAATRSHAPPVLFCVRSNHSSRQLEEATQRCIVASSTCTGATVSLSSFPLSLSAYANVTRITDHTAVAYIARTSSNPGDGNFCPLSPPSPLPLGAAE